LGEARRASILQLSPSCDSTPDDPCEELRPYGPVHADICGEPEHGNLGGKQSESQGPSDANGEQCRDEHDCSCGGTESEGSRVDVSAEWTRSDAEAIHLTLLTAARLSVSCWHCVVAKTLPTCEPLEEASIGDAWSHLKQWVHAERDELPHRERRLGAFDAGHGEHLAVDTE